MALPAALLEARAGSADRTERIRQAVIRSRNEWVDLAIDQERELFRTMETAASRITEEIGRFEAEGKFPPARLPQLLDNIKRDIAQMSASLGDQIQEGMRASIDGGMRTGMAAAAVAAPGGARVGVGSAFIGTDGTIHKYDARQEAYADSAWAKINYAALTHLLRYRPGGETLSATIWKMGNDAERAVRNSIMVGVTTGRSIGKITQDVRQLLVEPDRRFQRVRDERGALALSRAALGYHPGAGVYRSSYKNALRLARTEYARAFSEGVIRYGEEMPWIVGYIHRVASSNPCPLCLRLNGVFFEKSEMRDQGAHDFIRHPNCYCYPEEVVSGDVTAEMRQRRERYDRDQKIAQDTGMLAVDLGAMPDDMAKTAGDALRELHRDYDSKMHLVDTVVTDRLAVAEYDRDTRTLHLNPKYFFDRSEIENQHQVAMSRGERVQIRPGISATEAYLTHEFGHSLLGARQIGRSRIHRPVARLTPIGRLWADYQEQHSRLVSTGTAIRGIISNRAAKDLEEFIADSFEQHRLGDNVNEYAAEVATIIDREFRRGK